jgi:hypothetical protein
VETIEHEIVHAVRDPEMGTVSVRHENIADIPDGAARVLPIDSAVAERKQAEHQLY